MEIPIYSSQQQLGSPKTAPVRRDQVFKDPWAEAVKSGLDTLEGAIERRRLEKAEGKALKSVSQYRTLMRPYMVSEGQRKGFDAGGSQERHDKAHKEAYSKVTMGMDKTAQVEFDKRVIVRYDAQADKLAFYEAGQNQTAKVAAVDASQAELKEDINEGLPPEAFNARLIDQADAIIRLNPGMDAGHIVQAKTTDSVKAYMLDAVVRIPEQVPELIKTYDKYLNEGDQEKLYDLAEKGMDVKQADAVTETFRRTNDFDVAINYVNELTDEAIRPGAKEIALTKLRDWKSQKDGMKRDADIKVTKQLNKDVVNNLMSLNYEGVRQLASQYPNPLDKLRWTQIADNAEAKNYDVNVTDPGMKAGIYETITMNPYSMSMWQIWSFHGKGMSTNACVSATKYLNDVMQNGVDLGMQQTFNEIDVMRKDGVFGEDSVAANTKATKIKEYLFKQLSKNPKANIYTDIWPAIKKSSTEDGWDRFWNKWMPGRDETVNPMDKLTVTEEIAEEVEPTTEVKTDDSF